MEGDAKSRRPCAGSHRRNPGAAIVVMGCYATRDPEAVAQLPGVAAGHHRQGPNLARICATSASTTMPAGISRFDDHQRRLRQGAGRLPAELHLLHHPFVRPIVAAARRKKSPRK